MACAAPATTSGSGGNNGSGSGGSNNNSGGSNGSGSGGSNNSGGSNGSGGSNSSGGSNGSSGGSNGSGGNTAKGGSNGSGGSVSSGGNTGNGGSSSSGGNTGNGGSSSSGGNTGSGGSSSSGGNTGNGGSSSSGGSTGSGGSSSGRPSGCPAVADTISDFEEGNNAIVTPQGGRQGWWYVFSDATNNGGMSPAASTTNGITSAALPSGDPNSATCDKWDLEVKSTAAHSTWGAGFGTSMNQILPPPTGTTAQTKKAYDVSAYDGISFNIKSASGSAPPIWFEMATLNNQPVPDGSIKTSDGTASGTAQAPSSNGTDEYNTLGMLINNIGTSWTKVYVPFKILGPRYLPAGTTCSNSAVLCQAPVFKATDVLGIQFANYTQFTSNAWKDFDVVVDDVALFKGTNGLASFTKGALAVDGSVGSCSKPTGATMTQLQNMYANWKATFVTPCGGNCVMRPENANDVVSEGIGYGMLIAVNMNDKTLFDALWSFEQGHKSAGNLMLWCLGAQKSGGMGSACNASGGGSATDADEDMAFALLLADKQWPGGSYKATATSLIGDIWSHDIDTSSNLPTGGSNYGSTSSKVTNPSYFAPAYYRAFASVDNTTSGHNWNTIASSVYTAISSIASKAGKAGLIPAWCSSNCTAVGSNGGSDDSIYQYDAHRVPWRLGVDACWNGTTSASSFLSSNASFFASQASAGIDRVYDIYTLSGGANGDAAQNSMSAIGTAGVGAMAAGNSFMNTAYQFILDASYSPASQIPDTSGRVSYSYFNATVGLLSALTMSGNFNHP
jgi:endo-1,4-beta-D-glucanase Y